MRARFQTMPLAAKIGIVLLILIALWVLVQFFAQRWIEEAIVTLVGL